VGRYLFSIIRGQLGPVSAKHYRGADRTRRGSVRKKRISTSAPPNCPATGAIDSPARLDGCSVASLRADAWAIAKLRVPGSSESRGGQLVATPSDIPLRLRMWSYPEKRCFALALLGVFSTPSSDAAPTAPAGLCVMVLPLTSHRRQGSDVLYSSAQGANDQDQFGIAAHTSSHLTRVRSGARMCRRIDKWKALAGGGSDGWFASPNPPLPPHSPPW
jgi:hypothetical protein